MRNRIDAVLRSALCLAACTYAVPAIAQVVPDGTLPVNSTVVPNGNSFVIEGGTTAGANLFHSFREFSLPTGSEAWFNNAVNIENILSRVTGGGISNIDGLIRANGGANLFLINPRGIVFGPNARLNIGGSFFASSAESVVFENGIAFSASNPEASPLLTINVPLGLQWGNNPQPVVVSGSSLAVEPGKNLTVAAGTVNLDGASLLAPGGGVELSSVAPEGQLPLGNSSSFSRSALGGDIQLENAQVDATSATGGTIAVNAGNLSLRASTLSAGLTAGGSDPSINGGGIAINVAGQTSLNDRSLIANDVQAGATGNGGNIELTTGNLELSGGSRIQTVTNSTGSSGEIVVNANGVINISGFTEDGLFSGILSRAATPNSGTGGNITVNNPQNLLNLSNRGFIGAVTNSNNNGGGIEINVNNLSLEAGGQIVTATTNLGNAGNILINATESVRISGESRDFVPNPFLDLATFDLNILEFSTDANPNIAESGPGGIPHVSVERTPTEIISGTTVLGGAEDRVDYYSFSVTAGGSRAILDIDEGFSETEGSFDTKIFLYNLGTGELINVNDDSEATEGGGGSIEVFDTLSTDSLIDTTLEEAGFYVLGVAAFPSDGENNQLVEGSSPQVGDTYTLQASIENKGNEGVAIPVDPFNPENFNPNVEARSGLFSESSAVGNGGSLTINTRELLVEGGGRISTDNSDLGIGGEIAINAPVIELRNSALVSSTTRGSGDSGNIALDTERLTHSNGGTISTNTFGSGNAGIIRIAAAESIVITNTGIEAASGRSSIRSSVSEEARGNGGTIEIETPLLRLIDAGQILASTSGDGNGGEINIQAGSVEVIGEINPFPSGILGESQGNATGEAGSINIVTDRLRILDGGQISVGTRTSGNSGTITVRASESVEVIGTSDSLTSSGLFVAPQPGSTGDGGNLTIETERLRIADGGTVNASTLGAGNGGNISIQATEVEASSAAVDFLGLISGLTVSVGEGGTGNGGNITIDAERLRVVNGGQVRATSLGNGNAGDIILRVDEIEVTGISDDGEFVSSISALSETDFAAGSIDIKADRLQVSDRGEITVSSTGAGDAGNLNIAADRLDLDRGGRLSSEVQAGSQGNINLSTDSLQLRRGSITTNASETATGGNIKIDSETVALIQNSQITADAIQGAGGNISVSTEGIFVSPNSSITASSQFGVDGIVEINNPDTDSSQGLVELSQAPVDTKTRIVTGCASALDNSFIVTGRGGIPPNPEEQLIGDRPWTDLRDLSRFRGEVSKNTSPEPVGSVEVVEGAIVEANSWRTNARGEIELVAVVEASHPAVSSLPPKCQG
ncbi:MAG: filamentous hemagglutinin N-terminal domain-containing protein [Oscillatoria sp. SIO1A7]|nr:filamentous hemagglutinin N-terminal domain-containing protein [Oscillatoria sp. SIO1A7]